MFYLLFISICFENFFIIEGGSNIFKKKMEDYKDDLQQFVEEFSIETIAESRRSAVVEKKDEESILSLLDECEQNVLILKNSSNPNELFQAIKQIRMLMDSPYINNIIQFFVDCDLMDILFPIINSPNRQSNLFVPILNCINVIIANVPNESIHKFSTKEYFVFLIENLTKPELYGVTSYFIWKALAYLFYFDDDMDKFMLESFCMEKFQKIIESSISFFKRKKPIYFLGNGSDDDDIDILEQLCGSSDSFDIKRDSNEEEEERHFEINKNIEEEEDFLDLNTNFTRNNESLNWLGEICFYKLIVDKLFSTMNDEEQIFCMNIFITAITLPHIPGSRPLGLKALITMARINPELTIQRLHLNPDALSLLYSAKNDSNQLIVSSSLELIYILLSFDLDCLEPPKIFEFLYDMINSFKWENLTQPFKWTLHIISLLSSIRNIQNELLPDNFLLDIDAHIMEAEYKLKKALIIMLCHIVINANEETKSKIYFRYNFVASIFETTSHLEDDNDLVNLVLPAIAEILKQYVVSSWDFLSKDATRELVDKDFIESQVDNDNQTGETSRYIISVLDND